MLSWAKARGIHKPLPRLHSSLTVLGPVLSSCTLAYVSYAGSWMGLTHMTAELYCFLKSFSTNFAFNEVFLLNPFFHRFLVFSFPDLWGLLLYLENRLDFLGLYWRLWQLWRCFLCGMDRSFGHEECFVIFTFFSRRVSRLKNE